MQRVDSGFQPDGLQTFDVSLPTQYTREKSAALFETLQEHVSGLPQVSSSGAVSLLPLSGSGSFSWPFLVRGRPVSESPVAEVRMATPGALETLGVPVRRGRSFRRQDTRAHSRRDRERGPGSTAWPGEDPIGKQLRLAGAIEVLPWMTVIGTVGDVRFGAPDRAAPPVIYRPYTQHWRADMTFVLRVAGSTVGARCRYDGRSEPSILSFVR